MPWVPETLTGLVEQLIKAAEENRVGIYLVRCEKAGLTGKLVKEIEADARFPDSAKTLLKHSLPRLAAKWLNKAGISAEWQEEISVITALLLIFQHEAQVNARFKKLVEELHKEKPKEEGKK